MAERAVRLLAAMLALAGALTPVAAAAEAPTLFPGTTALVKGTPISCTTDGANVRCKTGNLVASLSRAGNVGVLRGSGAAAGMPGKVMHLGLNGGFIAPNSAAYCHVYAAPAPTMTCSLVRPKGGIPSTQGFDMSSRAVVVYRYDATHARHDVAHYAS
jgi:hypothetical protein